MYVCNRNYYSINFYFSITMKKTRIIRALKKCKSTDFKNDRVFSFVDEKGKQFFIAEQQHYMNIITQAVNTILDRVFDIIDNVELKKKILKGLNDDKK